MLRFIWSLCLSFLFVVPSFAALSPLEKNNNITRVIYITLDGTRWQDIFLDHTYFPKLWSKYANSLTFYGAPASDTTIEVASIPVSLPSYQSQLAGSVQSCGGNDCGRINVPTFAEDILHKLNLDKKEVATFSSWPTISLAVEYVFDTTFTNTGNMPMADPTTHIPDATMSEINLQQINDHPSGFDRFDKYTFAQALHYLEAYQPRFMWISFDDADEAAHSGSLEKYHQALSFYDDMLDKLFTTLTALNLDKETLVIVTTDHGRGNGIHWTSHGPEYPESKQTWAFVKNGELIPMTKEGNIYRYSTLSMKPTIEAAFGIV